MNNLITWEAENLKYDSVFNEVTGKNVVRLPKENDFILIGGFRNHIRFGICVNEANWNGKCQLLMQFEGIKEDFAKQFPNEYQILEKENS